MKIFLSSLIPNFIIFTLFPSKVMPDVYITATPRDLEQKVGQSATLSCLVSEKIDIREIYLFRSKTKILSLTVQTSILATTLRFSGTFEKFKWTMNNEEEMDPYMCTDKTEMSGLEITEKHEGTNQIDCPSPHESSTHLFLKSGNNQIASFWISPSGYRSRLNISGTIRNLSITLKNLTVEDTDLYEWKGKAEGIPPDEVEGEHTVLNVRSHGMSISTGQLGLAFPVALASCLCKFYQA